MQFEFQQLLNQDLSKAQADLSHVLSNLTPKTMTNALLAEGLCATHTLKALAAVNHQPGLEQYAAQLEQVFVAAQKVSLKEAFFVLEAALPELQILYKEALDTMTYRSSTIKNNKKLTKIIDTLQKLDQNYKTKRQEAYNATLQNNEVSLEAILQGFTPWINQAARESKKKIQFSIQVPRPIALPASATNTVQTLMVHLLRNAVFHGIEAETERTLENKNPVGTIEIIAERIDENLVLSVSDDGRGLRRHQDEAPSSNSIFSTTENSTTDNTALDTSIYALSNPKTGLGIGLHIVFSKLASLGGTLDLKSAPQAGTCALLTIPFLALCDFEDGLSGNHY